MSDECQEFFIDNEITTALRMTPPGFHENSNKPVFS